MTENSTLRFDATPDEISDDDFAPPPARQPTGKTTVALGVLAVLALGFLGGALVQKHEGGTSTATGRAGTRARGGGGFGAAAAEGGFAGFGGFGGATGAGAGAGGAAGATGTGAGTGADAGGSTASTTPEAIAIGTVVSISPTSIVVKNLAGQTKTLPLGSGVTLTTSTPLTATAVKPGQTITVDGTTGASGAVTVTSLVVRK